MRTGRLTTLHLKFWSILRVFYVNRACRLSRALAITPPFAAILVTRVHFEAADQDKADCSN